MKVKPISQILKREPQNQILYLCTSFHSESWVKKSTDLNELGTITKKQPARAAFHSLTINLPIKQSQSL